MSTKRKNQDGDGTNTPHSHNRKKVKIQGARQIAIQVPAHVADGACPIVWIASWPNTPTEGGSQLPVSLDVERFADVNLVHPLNAHSLMLGQARRFEITAMQDSIVNAR
jgi:hypothetical protein